MRKPETLLPRERTSNILLHAHALMRAYAQATGTRICVLNCDCLPIFEMREEIVSEKNACLFCMKFKKGAEVKNFQDLAANPCREMHIGAVKESQRLGGSYCYSCPLGFKFWTSPIYLNERFAGALLGGGILGTGAEEARAKMRGLCEGALGETELARLLDNFPREEPGRIKALAEMTLICAQSLSAGSEGRHGAAKRSQERRRELSAKIEDLKKRLSPNSPRPEYPMDQEEKLLDALRQGDEKEAKLRLDEILAFLFFTSPDHFKRAQYRAVELAVLLSRIDTVPGAGTKYILENNNRQIKSIEEAENFDELADALYKILEKTAAQLRSFHGIRHASALKKAEHYILENFSRKISLEEISKASGFSAPYFSTIFKEEMGENLSSYLNRLRVEKAGYMLTETNLSLCKIARACGFEDQSWFSKIFKSFMDVSPGKYRNQGGGTASKPAESEFSDEYRLMANAPDSAREGERA